MRRITIAFAVGVLIILGNYTLNQAGDPLFQFMGGPLQDSYLPYEPIVLDLMVTNTTKDTLRVKTLSLWAENVRIILINQDGDTLGLTEHVDVIEGEGVLLQKEGIYYTNVNLAELFGRGLVHKRLPVGTYQVQTAYGSQSSPILTFQVKEPKGSNKDAYELLRAGYEHQLAKEPDQAIRSFQSILTRLPDSKYVELAYYDLAQSYRVYRGDANKSDTLQAMLIREFPNSFFVRSTISRLIRNKTGDEQKEFLTNVISKHPDTRCAMWAKRMLQSGY